MFVFGTQYLRGETPERDQWMRDLENIRKNGFNTIRAWLNWNTLEKREGCIDEEYLHTLLNCVKQNDLQAGLLFHLHAALEWASRKYMEFWYVNEEGIPFEPAPRANTPNGGWPGLCFDHDEVREIEKTFIERIVAITKGHDEVAFYEPMKEPHQWVDMSKKPAGMFCYCYAPGSTVAEDRTAGADTRTTDAKRIVMKICSECGVTPNPCSDSGIRGNILFNETQDDLLFLLNNENRPVDATFFVGTGYENAAVIFGNGSANYKGDAVHFKLGNYETLVLRMKK